MNLIIKASRLLVVCGIFAAGCDMVQDVKSEPATGAPGPVGLMEGVIRGLAPVRAVVLNAGVTTVEGYVNTRPFFGALSEDQVPIEVPFSYVAVPVGTAYNFTVVEHPFGKICTIANASGTAGTGAPPIEVTCVDDPAVFRYPISVTVAPAVATLPEFTVYLNAPRDFGVESAVLNGATSHTFTNQGINPKTSAAANIASGQTFQWTITATFKGDDERLYQCRVVTSPTNNTTNNGGTSAATGTPGGVVPTNGPVSRHVHSCLFPIEVNVKYSAPPGGADQPMGAGGVTLGLQPLGSEPVPAAATPVTITNFTPGSNRVTLWTLPSYPGAAYDLVVTQHPEGQTCIVRVLSNGAPAASGLVTGESIGSALMLTNILVPAHFTPNPNNVANGISVRCRNNPAPGSRLSGVFKNINEIEYSTNPFVRIRERQFLSFFDNGTFLFGVHSTSGARTGIEYGFYDYNPMAATLDFNVFLDTSTQAGTFVQPATPIVAGPIVAGVATPATPPALSNMLGYGPAGQSTAPGVGNTTRLLANNAATAPNGGVLRATNVQLITGSPASITMTFSGPPINTTITGSTAGNATGPSTTSTITFTEPLQVAGQMTGAWVSGDKRRMWIYDFQNTTGFHGGVNGIMNLQDACFVFNDPEASSSFYTRRGGSTGCMTLTGGAAFGGAAGDGKYFEYYEGGFATILKYGGFADNADGAVETAVPGFFGRFPGTRGAFDTRPPSPSVYEILPGVPESLSVYRTVNGVPAEAPLVLPRAEIRLD